MNYDGGDQKKKKKRIRIKEKEKEEKERRANHVARGNGSRGENEVALIAKDRSHSKGGIETTKLENGFIVVIFDDEDKTLVVSRDERCKVTDD